MEDLTALREAIRGANTEEDPALAELPFAALLSPMVAHTWNRLGRDPAWGPSAQTALRRDLGRRLAEVGAAALFADFSATRPQGVALQSHLGVGRGGDRAFAPGAGPGPPTGSTRSCSTIRFSDGYSLSPPAPGSRAPRTCWSASRSYRPEIAAVFGIPC
ncbi:MAG: hypothetical protein IPG68_01710 [Micrococcales bacterium]|nr:hypothetical protein [Micrococcales bacterium]